MLESIIKGIGLGLILAVSVGPAIFTILKHSINNGHKGGFSFVAGVWLSDLVLVIISNLFSSLVMEALAFKNTIGYVGAVFVVSLGIYYVFFKKVNFGEDKNLVGVEFGKKAFTKAFISGFIVCEALIDFGKFYHQYTESQCDVVLADQCNCFCSDPYRI